MARELDTPPTVRLKVDIHPYANLFPMMTTLELEALAADIQGNGLCHPVVRYEGKVLDGRNRLKACEMAGVEPTFRDFEGDDAGALALVISLNVQRRDMTAGQRAIVAARALPMFEAAGEARMKSGKSVDGEAGGRGKKAKPSHGTHARFSSAGEAGKVFKVGKQSIEQAKSLLSDAPDLASQVEVCTTSLAAAYEDLQTRRKEQARKARDAERVAEFKDAISSGEMSMDDALRQAMEEQRAEAERRRVSDDARSVFDGRMQSVIQTVRESVQPRTDEHLAWYTAEDAAPLKTNAQQVREAIEQLTRVLTHTFNSEV